MVERQYATQPQPIAAAEWPALKMTNGAERALPMSTKGFQTPSLRRRAQGNHGASGPVPPYGASAFRTLRSGLPSGYGVGEKISARPNISVLRQNRPRSSVRQQDFSARSLTSHHHVSCKQCVRAETRIVAAVAPAVTAARSDGRCIVESGDRLQQRTTLRSRHWISLDV